MSAQPNPYPGFPVPPGIRPPVVQTPVMAPPWAANHQTPSAYQPPTPSYYPTQIPQPPQMVIPMAPPMPPPVQQPMQPGTQQVTQSVAPPMIPQKDYSLQQLYDFQPYPGETIPGRLGKNIFLKSVSGLCHTFGTELGRFFQIWRWPPN